MRPLTDGEAFEAWINGAPISSLNEERVRNVAKMALDAFTELDTHCAEMAKALVDAANDMRAIEADDVVAGIRQGKAAAFHDVGIMLGHAINRRIMRMGQA